MQWIWRWAQLKLFPAWAVPVCGKEQSVCIIRSCSLWYNGFVNIKNILCCMITAKHQANSLWQTGWRFMCTLAYSYGVTRRGMNQWISASLLVVDKWSRPNMTVPSSIRSKDCGSFIYVFHWQQWWLIGNVQNVCPLLVLLSRGFQWPLAQRIYDVGMSFTLPRFIYVTGFSHLFL